MAERWKPNNGEEYFFVDFLHGGVQRDIYLNYRFDKKRWKNGNCFKTEAEAEAAAEKVKALLLNLQPEVATLPKLTAEVFYRPDCPEWAKYAAVNMHGIGSFYENEPSYGIDYYKGFWYVDTGRTRVMQDIIFDASDWQNSLIERPAKLPDWCKEGEWVFVDDKKNCISFYMKITEVDEYIYRVRGSYANNKRLAECGFDLIKQAHLRPYDAGEVPDLPFEVTEKNSNFRTTVVSCNGDKVWLAGASIAISTEELMRDFTAKGNPCGILEHLKDGEWVK